MAGNPTPSAGYKFNSMQEIKSHSSVLYNERMAILFYMLDMNSIELNTNYEVEIMLKVKAIMKQIYKNIRTLIRNNPTMRATLNLETNEEGVYVTDVIDNTINKMMLYCQQNEYTEKRIYIIVEQLNNFEVIIKDILQYYHYFIRPDFRQKPDIEIATESYKEIVDKRTLEELKDVLGVKHKIDFDSLGSKRIDLPQNQLFDEIEKEEDDDEDDGHILGGVALGMDHVDKELI